MNTVALDSSAALRWSLQQLGWQAVDMLLRHPELEVVLPGPALTEVVYTARLHGTTSSPERIALALLANGMRVEPPTTDDLVRAAVLVETVRRTPGSSLSLADGIILAVAERLACPIVTADRLWAGLAADGTTSARVVQL